MLVELLVALPDHTWYTEIIPFPGETWDTAAEDLLTWSIEIFAREHPHLEVAALAIYNMRQMEDDDEENA